MCEMITPALAEVLAAGSLFIVAVTACFVGLNVYWRNRANG